MARSIWRGAISFSLIHIPVSLHTAARASSIELDMLDKHDFAPIGYQRYNKTTGKPVQWGDIVKGYQYEKGEYVVLTDEDFRRANVEASQTIDIHAFVDRSAITPEYFDTPYYLAPEKQGEKVYALLRDALARSNKVAVASVVIRTRQHMAALLPMGGVILMNTLRFDEEVLEPPQIEGARPTSRRKGAHAEGKELQMALKLIDEMTEDWQPEQYQDTYRNDLMKRIDEKIKAGQTKTLTAPEKAERRAPAAGKIVDLMALLRQSLDEQSGQSAGQRSRRHRAARRRTTQSRTTRRRA